MKVVSFLLIMTLSTGCYGKQCIACIYPFTSFRTELPSNHPEAKIIGQFCFFHTDMNVESRDGQYYITSSTLNSTGKLLRGSEYRVVSVVLVQSGMDAYHDVYIDTPEYGMVNIGTFVRPYESGPVSISKDILTLSPDPHNIKNK